MKRLIRSAASIFFVATIVVAVAVAPASAQRDLSRELAQALREYAANTFSTGSTAAIAVQVRTPDGDVRAATGLRDGIEPAQPGDRFRIASMSKTFVAATALVLAEEGLLALDEPVARYLPPDVVASIANLGAPHGATLRHLLAMQSGIADYLDTAAFWDVVYEDPSHPWTAWEALEYAYGLPPLFEPGTRVSYSNTNYLVAQLVLEAAGHAPLHDLVRAYVLTPLGLRDTYTQAFEHVADTPESAFVVGYEDWDGDGVLDDVSAINDGFGLGDGALISTTHDLVGFYDALLLDQSLLSADSLAQMMTFADYDGGGYGLALENWATDFGEAYGHSGLVPGFVSLGAILPDHETIVVALCATDECDPEVVIDLALNLVLGN